MVIHFVRFKTHLAPEEVQRIMEERAPRFRSEVPGLVQKTTATSQTAGPSAVATSLTQKSPDKHSVRVSWLAPFQLPTSLPLRQRRCA